MRRFWIGLAAIVLAVAAAFAVWFYRQLHSPAVHGKANDYIEIPRGSTPESIANTLVREGVLRRKWPFLFYVRITRSAKLIKAGEYRFPSPISPLGVLRKLEEGEQRLSRFTVIEGWTRWDIADSLAHVEELHLQDSGEALRLMDDTSAIHDLDPAATNLEGYLFPATYSFPPETRPATVKLKEERPMIASVIYNRLNKHIALGIDSTIVYASKLAGKWRNDGKVYLSDVNRRSPYNTRLFSGLPPGPIGSPGESSIDAALNPAQTDYLYYVREPSRDDGAHNFYAKEADFQKGVRALREWERSQGR